MKNIIIRKESKEDYKKTEYMVMRAFWNLHGPGCNEHLLVRKIRESKDFIPQLSRVAEIDGEIVGAIFYTKAWVKDEKCTHEIITFGPLAVEPTHASEGIGARLLEETIELAKAAGYPGIVILGEPNYYPKYGFTTTEQYHITCEYGYIDALMGYKLNDDFDHIHGKLVESSVFEEAENEEELERMTKEFPYHKPLTLSCQWLHEERLGRICEIQKNTYIIKYWEKELVGKLKGSFYKEDKEPPVVGDYVTFLYNPIGDCMITNVCERSSFLKRPDQSGHAIGYVKTMKEQAMVANIDYVFIVASLNDNYNFNRIARYITVTLQGNANPVVILTKMDLCSNPGRYIREVEEISEKVCVHAISALYEIGINDLEEYLSPGATIVMLGSSGAGKSTLINALMGKDAMKTSDIRESDSKGRHTTTHRQVLELRNGAFLIDTPGMREIGMCDVNEGINETFSDIVKLEQCCKFGNCKHDTEPGCAIKAAISDGTLTLERYELYKSLHAESNKAKKMKAISKYRKEINKGRN